MSDYTKVLFAILLWVWLIGSWFTHVIHCFIDGAWGFLIAGALMFPVAVVHGTWLWF